MSPRLIPWFLAATGFLAALSVCSWPVLDWPVLDWQGKLADPSEGLQPQAPVGQPLTLSATDHHESRPARALAATAPAENAPSTLILPLPPATQPEPDPDVQSLADDEPTVDDLPAPRSPPESPEGD